MSLKALRKGSFFFAKNTTVKTNLGNNKDLSYLMRIHFQESYVLKPAIIILLILILQITTFACDWQNINSQFQNSYSSQTKKICQTVEVSKNNKFARISCSDKKSYSVSYDHNSIYMLTETHVKNNLLSQCWISGKINQKCEVALDQQKCQAWDLKTY